MKAAGLMLGLGVVLVLGGCGGSGYHDDTPQTTTPPPPVSMVDKFVTAVLAVIGDGAETTTEPQAIDNVAITTPEDSEPVAVK